jgi:hypothetical protein
MLWDLVCTILRGIKYFWRFLHVQSTKIQENHVPNAAQIHFNSPPPPVDRTEVAQGVLATAFATVSTYISSVRNQGKSFDVDKELTSKRLLCENHFVPFVHSLRLQYFVLLYRPNRGVTAATRVLLLCVVGIECMG